VKDWGTQNDDNGEMWVWVITEQRWEI
jgi:hypothetical protein